MTEPTTVPVLQLEEVSVTYPNGTVALRPTTLALHRGEIAVLLGISGAGKSSLLRSVNQLVAPTSGRVISAALGAITTKAQLREHRRHTGMVFQHHQLIARHSALANVLTGRLAFHSTGRSLLPLPRADRELALHCLERVGLLDQALTRVDQLSGGQQQRVGIARALAQQPPVILADEPVASLDPATAQKVLELLRGICRQDGITAVVSLHQLDYARRFADRIIGVAKGGIVFDGLPHQLDEAQLARIYFNGNHNSGSDNPSSGSRIDTARPRRPQVTPPPQPLSSPPLEILR